MSEHKRQGRSPWGWGIAAVYTAFALTMLAFVVYSTTQRVDLVSVDYYEQGQKHQSILDQSLRTKQSGKTPSVAYNSARQELSLCFDSTTDTTARGTIVLFRPSASGLDQSFNLQLDSDHCFRMPHLSLLAGYWRVKIAWSCNGSNYYSDQPLMVPK